MADVYNVRLARRSLGGGISEMTVTYDINFNHVEKDGKVRFHEYIIGKSMLLCYSPGPVA